jgi:hypothetical protein
VAAALVIAVAVTRSMSLTFIVRAVAAPVADAVALVAGSLAAGALAVAVLAVIAIAAGSTSTG